VARKLRKIVVDSDVLIEVLRGNSAVAAALTTCVARGTPVALTPIAVAEVLAGVRPAEETGTRALLAAFDCLRVDRAVGEVAGRFLSRFGASHGVGLADALVAACATTGGYRLWTLNRKHYPMRTVRFYAPPG
jgi:predicted nucleic acid-binding protein